MPTGKLLVIAGLFLLIAGLFIMFGPKIPFLGKLPGDIHVKREKFSVYFPLTTCILVSIIVSLLFWLFRK